MNYFELYQLPVHIGIDKGNLRRKYLLLSKQYHPDYFDESGTMNSDENLKIASDVNEAYEIFQDQNATIGYILELKNKMVKDEKYQLPPDFLMDMMELNESFDEDTINQIEILQAEIKNPVSDLINAPSMEQFTQKEYDLLKEYYYKYKYLDRLRQRNSAQEEFDA